MVLDERGVWAEEADELDVAAVCEEDERVCGYVARVCAARGEGEG